VFRNKLTKDDRLIAAFDTMVLSAAINRKITVCKIIHGDDHGTLKVKTAALANEVRKLISKIVALLASPAPPDLILNRHCAECEYQARCRQQALDKDDLSLLANMSEKERKKLHGKGIFTVMQLSYTFRPRRRSKRQRDRREKYHHSLKALAIRENKIHIVGSPELKIEGTPVYLDVEGVPDRDFYYLIGMRIGNGESAVQYSLWADTVNDEEKIWLEFLGILETVENPVLIHYGSYETIFLKRMCENYAKPSESSIAARAIHAAMNLLSFVFAKVYFPCYTNGLKELARHIGFRWSDSTASGTSALVWRQEWESSGKASAKQSLLIYNTDDCIALQMIANTIPELRQGGANDRDIRLGPVVNAAEMKREHPYGFKRNTFAFPELNAINNAAYWDYQRERVYVKSNVNVKRALTRPERTSRDFPPNKPVLTTIR
jgi:predicted RecB family nuclease